MYQPFHAPYYPTAAGGATPALPSGRPSPDPSQRPVLEEKVGVRTLLLLLPLRLR